MKKNQISAVIQILKEAVKKWKQPIVGAMGKDPYKILIATILSLRTKDATTEEASKRLFAIADTPLKMIQEDISTIENAIYPVGFYKRKAINIFELSKVLLDKYEGNVPDEIDDLLSLKGVGRKTANLTVTLGFNKPGICVDIHVHRITNRWGYVKTKNPDETEMVLREKLPEKHWIEINDLLVCFGQNLCTPVSPHCSICPVYQYCDRVGVTSSR
jgi:endonuclease-3